MWVCSDTICQFLLSCPTFPTWKRSCSQPAQVASALEVIASGTLGQKKWSKALQAVCTTSKTFSCPCLLAGLSTHRTCVSVCSHINRHKLPITLGVKQCSHGKQPQMRLSKRATLDHFQSMLELCDAVV